MRKIRYNDYHGARKYRVTHPDQEETVDVFAPDQNAAMCAAAEHWGVRWQNISFYTAVIVTEV